MKYTTTAVARLVLVLALAGVLVSTAFAKGGVTVRTSAPPPLDAGSSVPNPDYLRISPYARVSRGAIRPPAQSATRAAHGGFNWGDAGLGAGLGIAFVLIGIAPVLVLRQTHRRFVRGV